MLISGKHIESYYREIYPQTVIKVTGMRDKW